MKGTTWLVLLLSITVLGCPLWAGAVEQQTKVHRLDAVVISATRTETPVFDTPQDVTVITRREIMASPFERVEDIVRSVPGLYNFRHYSLQTNGIVSPIKMRGAGNNRVLFLVDGVPQNDNFNNAIAWVAWGHIPKETIERIEVVRGPSSALYGSEGLGGVIHIITREPEKKRRTAIRGEAGTGDTYSGSGFHSQTIKDLGVMVAGGYEESDGFYMTDTPAAYNIKRHRETGKILGKATYDLTPSSKLALSALYYDHETGKGREFFYDELNLDQYWLNYSHTFDTMEIKGLLYLNRADKTAFQDTASNKYTTLLREEKMPSTTWGADLQSTLHLGSWSTLTLGTAFKRASWDYDNDYAGSTRVAGAKGTQMFISPFANVDLKFLDDNLIVNLGGRFDVIETSDGANWDTKASAGKPAYDNRYDTDREESFSPKIGIAFHPDNRTTLRASGGKGFRAPSLFELYKVHVRSGGKFYRTANPDLKPEEIWSYDVGAERYLTDTLLGKLTFYQAFAKDYIGDRLMGTGTISGGKTRYDYKLDNISEVDIHGIEAELEWSPTRVVKLFANYTYNISKVAKDENNAGLEDNYLPQDPRHNAHFGIRYQNPGIFNLNLLVNYYADIYYDNENTLKTGDYWTMDIGVSRTFYDRFTLYVNGENIFDKEYPIAKSLSAGDTVSPGAIVSAGVKFEF
jgi:iron complex outermembrane receptor protein